MLSLFPQLLFLSPLATTLIRVALALLLAYEAWQMLGQAGTRHKVAGCCEALLALGLFVGYLTQLAALLTALAILLQLFLAAHLSKYPRSTLLLALAMAVSLVFMGAGAFAFDLPL